VKLFTEGSPEPLVTCYDAALLDLDGVLYVGPRAVDGAPEAVREARAAGAKVAFVTNNASRPPEEVAEHLTELGVTAEAGDVVTSAQAAARLVAEAVPSGSSVLVVGGEGLVAALQEWGLRPVGAFSEGPAAVVQGFGPDVGWRLLAEGTYAVRAGLPWVASNLDVTFPTSGGLAPGNGTLVNVIAQATGRRPMVAGKPETPLHQEAVRRTGATHPLVVGDRLDTDIEGANRAGVDALLVLTGVTRPIDFVRARPEQRPTYVAMNLETGLLRPHAGVRQVDDGRYRCGGWECRVGSHGIELSGSGDPLDGLRALAVACWEGGSEVGLQEAAKAVVELGL